jgi:ferredoxin
MKKKIFKVMIFFILSLIYSFGLILIVENLHYFDYILFWTAGMAMVSLSYRSFIPAMEASMLFATWFFFSKDSSFFSCLPLVATIILFTGYRAKIRFGPLFIILWFFLANKEPFTAWSFGYYFILFTTIAMIVIYLLNDFKSCQPLKKIDILYCTYSSNTGHFVKNFIEGLRKTGCEIVEHHFHYYSEPSPELNGDALVIAYPVYGWKVPWHFTSYILNKVPRGNGKPAFLIYTSGGGPENAGFVGWLLLTLKGYKVKGRAWGVYPINVATFRPLPNKIHKSIDKYLPWNQQLREIVEYGREFATGEYGGYPVIVWPFFLIIIGLLLDNKWLNVVYRNYAWKRRCTKCGICVRVCPVSRFYFGKDGYPKIKGTCTLCLSCINLCPTNAMHIFGWTEYGRPYKPKWPELLIEVKSEK